MQPARRLVDWTCPMLRPESHHPPGPRCEPITPYRQWFDLDSQCTLSFLSLHSLVSDHVGDVIGDREAIHDS